MILSFSYTYKNWSKIFNTQIKLNFCAWSLSHVWLFSTLWLQHSKSPLSMGFSRQEYWNGLPLPSPGDLPNPGIEPGSLALPCEPAGKPQEYWWHFLNYFQKLQGWGFWDSSVVKNPPANVGDIRALGSIPGLGRFPGEGNGNPLQYSCLENPMDRRAWRAAVHRVAKSWTRLKWLSTHTHTTPRIKGDMESIFLLLHLTFMTACVSYSGLKNSLFRQANQSMWPRVHAAGQSCCTRWPLSLGGPHPGQNLL